jgi:hypothetical protein
VAELPKAAGQHSVDLTVASTVRGIAVRPAHRRQLQGLDVKVDRGPTLSLAWAPMGRWCRLLASGGPARSIRGGLCPTTGAAQTPIGDDLLFSIAGNAAAAWRLFHLCLHAQHCLTAGRVRIRAQIGPKERNPTFKARGS